MIRDPEMMKKENRQWLWHIGVKSLYIAPGNPWANGYNECFNGN
jgi:transposase InsO family protein